MLQFTQGQVEQVVLSLEENQTLTAPNYLFYFVHRSLNNTVAFVLLNAADTSTYKWRYSQFSITVNNYFLNEPVGEWEYFVYEQSSTTNLIPASATTLLEQGIMKLNKSTEYSFTEYQTSNTFITR